MYFCASDDEMLGSQTVGDAISDLLVVEAILLQSRMTVADWAAMYDDLPNRLLKVTVGLRQRGKQIKV
jgi:phosphoacetylglucosamine mutase